MADRLTNLEALTEAVRDPDFVARLHRLVSPEPNTGCWLWVGVTHDNGYGRIIHRKQHSFRSHRAFYLASGGTLREGEVVCHRCDNPICVNPEHLFAGTSADNSADMKRKSRAYRWNGLRTGEANPAAKLTVDDILRIRALAATGRSQKAIAAEFGIAASSVHNVIRNKNWQRATAAQRGDHG